MQNIERISADFPAQISQIDSLEKLENLRLQYLGKKGVFTDLMENLKTLDLEQKKHFGSLINQLKNEISTALQNKKDELELIRMNEALAAERLDLTQPVRQENRGFIHPISQTINEIKTIFGKMGFELIDGPEIEDDFHNFSALNIPENHPARQMQDTFYLPENDGKKMLLRTHTSSVQIRKMLAQKPPLKIVSLGKVYRSDSDQTHTPMFHQIEALVVDENINMGNLKWVIEKFLSEFFEIENLATRFRPSFFPFTEPSAELDIGYSKKDGNIKIGSDENFLEILGCGMVHPQVLENTGIDSSKYQGFAFGIGIERLAMLKYGINDLRMFFEGDLRFLKHYGFVPSIS
ncbi:MAG: phenylalanyl-tRNA synthetase alpha chain [Rickettsiaceae bacterium]|jgi:phenylalanyl-tRNA synthetase alpha chain|nr:phenylalanyl-tRNA synthetase alpha chain [Rickettsiaceae bacterium]